MELTAFLRRSSVRSLNTRRKLQRHKRKKKKKLRNETAINLRVESTVTPPGEKTTDAYNSFWRDGYWYKVPMTTLHTSQVVDPPDGRVPPLTPPRKQDLQK